MKVFGILGALIAIGIGFIYWQKDNLPWMETQKNSGPPAVAVVEKRDITLRVKASGDIQPISEMEIRSEVGGMIKEVFVDLGDLVTRGQPLLQIDDTNLLIERERTRNELEGQNLLLEQARRDYLRVQQLAEKDLVSQEEVDQKALELAMAENEYKKVNNDLQLVEDRLGKTMIKAPMDGTILDVQVDEGQVVTSTDSNSGGTTLINLADLSKMLIHCHVNQVDITGVDMGDVVTFETSSLPGELMTGEVVNIAPVATVVRGTKGFQVRLFITSSSPKLRPGMTAEVEFQVAEVKNALSLPLHAIFLDEQDNSIVYINTDGKTVPHKIEVGLSNFDYTEILSGLQEGQEALLEKPVVPADSARS